MGSPPHSRRLAALALLATMGCADGPPVPAALRIVPGSTTAEASVAVTIEGRDFRRRTVAHAVNGEVEMHAEFGAWLGDNALQEVRWLSSDGLSARVPAGLALGIYDLRLADPFGREIQLEHAFAVVAGEGTGGAGGTGAGGAATGVGGAATGAGGAGGEAGGPLVAYCDEPGILGCYPFDGDSLDASLAEADAMATSVSYVLGVKGQAIALDDTSLLTADSAKFATSALTIELWVRPLALPTGGARVGLMDHGGRFGMWLYSDGLRCSGTADGNTIFTAGSPVTQGQWTHVACTNDGANLRAFVAGAEVASLASAPIAAGSSPEPVTIGSNSPSGDKLTGELDELRVFGVAKTPAEICASSGEPGC